MTIVRGAYGRTYKSGHDARKDWFAGKDFRIVNGAFINLADANNYAYLGVPNPHPIKIRYDNDQYSTIIYEGQTE